MDETLEEDSESESDFVEEGTDEDPEEMAERVDCRLPVMAGSLLSGGEEATAGDADEGTGIPGLTGVDGAAGAGAAAKVLAGSGAPGATGAAGAEAAAATGAATPGSDGA